MAQKQKIFDYLVMELNKVKCCFQAITFEPQKSENQSNAQKTRILA